MMPAKKTDDYLTQIITLNFYVLYSFKETISLVQTSKSDLQMSVGRLHWISPDHPTDSAIIKLGITCSDAGLIQNCCSEFHPEAECEIVL